MDKGFWELIAVESYQIFLPSMKVVCFQCSTGYLGKCASDILRSHTLTCSFTCGSCFDLFALSQANKNYKILGLSVVVTNYKVKFLSKLGFNTEACYFCRDKQILFITLNYQITP